MKTTVLPPPEMPVSLLVFGIATALLTFLLFARLFQASPQRKLVLVVAFGWLAIQAGLASTDLYHNFDAFPPKVVLFGIAPMILTVVLLSASKFGKQLTSVWSVEGILLLNAVRIAVEYGLWLLYRAGWVPVEMTFEGRNLDVASGILALGLAFMWMQGRKKKAALWVFNIAGILLLINIVGVAFLSAPTEIQKFGMMQPNMAIFYLPFVWLPTFIVPVVLWSHIVLTRKLLSNDIDA